MVSWKYNVENHSILCPLDIHLRQYVGYINREKHRTLCLLEIRLGEPYYIVQAVLTDHVKEYKDKCLGVQRIIKR